MHFGQQLIAWCTLDHAASSIMRMLHRCSIAGYTHAFMHMR